MMVCSFRPGHVPHPVDPFPFVRLVYEQLEAAPARKLGEPLLRRYHAVPLTPLGGQARFALADLGQREALAQELHRAFTAVMASAAEIEAALDVIFGREELPLAEAALYYLLRSLGLLSDTQVQALRQAEREEGRPPGWALVRLGYLSEKALAEALGLTFSLPHVRLQRWPLNAALFRAVSALPRVRGRALPLMVMDSTLYLAVADPSDCSLLQQVERGTGFQVMPVVVEASAMEKATARLERAIHRDERRLKDLWGIKGQVPLRHLELAQEVAWHTGETVAQVLVRLGACSEATARSISAQRQQLAPTDFDCLRDPDAGVLSLLPQVLAERLYAIPYARSEDGIRVAVAKLEQAWVADLVSYLADSPAVAEAAPAELVLTTIRRGLFRTSLLAMQGARRPEAVGPPVSTGAAAPVTLYTLLHRGGYIDREQFPSAALPDASAQALAAGLTDTDRAEALALFTGLPWVHELRLHPPSRAISLLPHRVAAAPDALPLAAQAGQLTVAVAQPAPETVRQLCSQLGPAARCVLAPADALRKARARLSELKPDTIPPMLREFGQYLHDRYGRTTAEVQRFWQRTVLQGGPADRVLAEEALVPADDVPYAFAQFLQAPLLDLRGEAGSAQGGEAVPLRWAEPVDVEVAMLLPRDRAEALAAVPLRREGTGILVAFADPLDLAARSEVGSLLGAPVAVAVAAREQIVALLRHLHNRVALGARLLHDGLISRQQLAAALNLQQRTGMRLSQALVQLGYVQQDALVQYLVTQYHLPFYRLRSTELDRQAALLVPEPVARQEGLLPIAQDSEHVLVATVDPGNEAGLALVSRRAGRRVELVLTSEDDLDWALAQLYSGQYSAQRTGPRRPLVDESASAATRDRLPSAARHAERDRAAAHLPGDDEYGRMRQPAPPPLRDTLSAQGRRRVSAKQGDSQPAVAQRSAGMLHGEMR